MVLYLLLCLVSVFAGCGILGLIGVEVDRRSTLALTPVITLCFITVFMGGLVAGGFTVGEITPFAYTLCLGTAILGAFKHGRVVLMSWRALLILAGLPLLILLPSLAAGFANYSGGMCLDGWAYVAMGQSLQRHPLGAEGWLPPEAQFTGQFGTAIRFMSSAFLALLAPLSGAQNDTQDVFGRYVGWLFFVYGCACLFFAKAARLTRPLAWIFVLVTLLSGWSLKLVNANSVDNTLAICFLPAVFGIIMLMPGPSMRQGVLLGGIVSAGLYAYPESAPFTVTAVLAMGAQRLFAATNLLREFGRMSVAFLITIAVCIAPDVLQIARFYRGQVGAATGPAAARPGVSFYQLLSQPHYALPGYWGLTPDFVYQKYSGILDSYATALAGLLTLTAIAGTFLLLRRRSWSLPLFVAGMTAAYAICLLRLRYPYAAYKILVLAWFAIAYLVVVALGWISEILRLKSSIRPYAGIGLGSVLVAGLSGFFFLQQKIFYDSLPFKSMREFKKLAVLENLARGLPVAMVVKDTYANIWAIHFLRDTKLYMAGQYRGYMTKAAMDNSEPVDFGSIRYVVTESNTTFEKEFLLSKEGPYYVWDLGRNPWVIVTEIDNPAGLPLQGSEDSSLWIAKFYTELQILSRSATHATINGEFKVESATLGNAGQHVHIATSADFKEECLISSGRNSFSVPLRPGINKLLLRSAEQVPVLIHADHLRVQTEVNLAAKLP
jgi:hypothetical protein